MVECLYWAEEGTVLVWIMILAEIGDTGEHVALLPPQLLFRPCVLSDILAFRNVTDFAICFQTCDSCDVGWLGQSRVKQRTYSPMRIVLQGSSRLLHGHLQCRELHQLLICLEFLGQQLKIKEMPIEEPFYVLCSNVFMFSAVGIVMASSA